MHDILVDTDDAQELCWFSEAAVEMSKELIILAEQSYQKAKEIAQYAFELVTIAMSIMKNEEVEIETFEMRELLEQATWLSAREGYGSLIEYAILV